MNSLMPMAVLILAGCVSTPEPRLCNTTNAASLVGSPATADLGSQIVKLSGARALRWIQPGTMVTMDFRRDRVNVRLDADNRVTRIDCG